MQTKIPESCSPVKAQTVFDASIDEALHALRQGIGARLTDILVAVAGHVVGRPRYVRRRYVSKRLHREGKCAKCGVCQSQRFSRNGFRERQPLATYWGEVPFALPRVVCQCGGSVEIDFGDLLRPYQRVGADVDAQIERWGSMVVNLRDMRRELGNLHFGPLALRTLNERLHQLTRLDPSREADDVPPVLQVDAIWVTQLRANGQMRRDRKGRQRPVKGRVKVPILIAVVRTYRHSQPEAVATLRRDFHLTVTYYAMECEHPSWERKHLRTTSRLERFNRRLRRRVHTANAYHSDTGLEAMLSQETHEFHLRQRAR